MTVFFHRTFSMLGILALLAAATGPAHATEAFSGGIDLKGWCDNMDRDDIHWGLCVGSITAAHDMVMTYQNLDDMSQLVCVNDVYSRGDVIDAVRAYMDENPDKLDFSLGDLVLSALMEKFSCN